MDRARNQVVPAAFAPRREHTRSQRRRLVRGAQVMGVVQVAALMAALAFTQKARAEGMTTLGRPSLDADRPRVDAGPTHHAWGLQMDMGLPDGGAFGLSVRPAVDWLRLGASITHNGIAPGVRLGITIDPLASLVAPTLTVEGGHYWNGTVPGIQNAPSIGYQYANFHLGIELGDRNSVRFFFRGGASFLDLTSAHAANTTSGIQNPTFSGWLAPSAKLGVSLFL